MSDFTQNKSAPSLSERGEAVGRSIKISGWGDGRRAAAALKADLGRISARRGALELKWQGLGSVPGGVRWLLDNYYLARREALTAAADLGRGGRARECSGGDVLGVCCSALVTETGSEPDEAGAEEFLRGFQRACVLDRRELSLLGAGLRAALIHALAEACDEAEAPEREGDFRAIFTSLRWLSTFDLTPLTERIDPVEQTLRLDPAGVYPQMDEETREYYRECLSELARGAGATEHQAAERVLSLARGESGLRAHVGYWIFRKPLGGCLKRRSGAPYMAANILITLFFSLLAAFAADSAAAFFLIIIPMSRLVKAAIDFAVLRIVTPCRVPRLELADGVPESGRTLCVVSALLASPADGAELAKRAEEYRLANRDCGKNLMFGILADLPENGTEDAEAVFAPAAAAVEALNAKYGGGFYLFTRPAAWERKRGAVEELMRLICGEASSLECAAGGSEALAGVKFLITLDSDTHLDPGSARRLIGAMLHPLNRPTVDKHRRVVVSGHGVISPRIAVELGAASRSDFARIYAGQGGTDPYGAACGEVYMDLARSGGYPGKGIVDIVAYRAVVAGRIPQGRVLSHDALEGAFLRAGFMGDTELTDGFPSGFLPWLRRQHRWIRGDWQNAPWIFARGRELRDIERYRLADSLRRSLEPVMTFAAIYLGFFLPQGGGALAALTALAACASELLGSLAASLTRPDGERRLRWHSAVLHGVGGGLVHTLVRLILLPAEAWFAFSAIVTALWRMCVTGKNLLAWQTAQQADSAKSGAGRYCLALWPAAVLGLAAAALSPAVIGRAAGVIWALSPLCALILSAKQPEERQAAESEREYLLAQSEKIWNYFDRFVTREDNFLPPDNFQFRPPVGLARRTSPTNIGLFLLSALTALDLGLTARERFAFLAGGCLDTLERLEKWRGHLYNWYDTATLAPLRPRYVSTVDSGNLCACLAALETGLDEYGFSDLARRAGALAAEMDFAPLFDGEKKLFFIGYDADSGQMTPSWYDLMASEAMLTGFLAVARGDVTRRHWRQLSRAQVQKNGYRGMASWTGTMFEYLMPTLLLPVYRDSLIYESVRFCVYAQRRRQGPNGVWGISESAFWALDPGMSYRYKAHGVQALALRRGMDAETVVSPYSSFLALAVSPKAAVANLRRLESMGLACDFGFCEAVDFTRGDGRGVVGCVMSHHLGMSLVAAGNYLTGGAMPRRFMSRPEMAAHALLLQEKVPVGGAVLRRGREGEAPPERRVSEERWSESGAAGNFRRPHCCLLAGMSYALAVTDTGVTLPRWGGVVPYAVPRGRSDEGHGVELDFDCGGARRPLLPTLGGEGRFERRFSASCAAFCGFFDGFSSEVSVMLSPDEAAEKRTVRLVPSEGTALRGRVRLTLRAVLGRWQDYLSHPAFAQLGISARAENGCLIMRRLARSSRDKELYLCIACDRPCRFDAAEGVASGRAQPEPLGAGERFLSSGLVCCSAEAELSAGAFAVSFAVGAAHTGDDARAVALRALELTAETAGAMPRSAARVLGMDESELGEVWRLLPELVFPPAAGPVRREELWRFGVSGDLPIVCAEYEKPEQLAAARRLMDKHLLICGCGADFDLVFITHDGAGYRKPLNDALSEALWRSGGEALQSARGGVHIVEECPEAGTFRRCAARIVSLDGETETEDADSEPAAKPLPAPDFVPSAHAPEVSWAPDGTVSFSTASALPPRSWANILTNGALGCLATDCGTGHMWHLNSRENQLSPWLGDPNSSLGAETLCAEAEGRLVSLFAAPDGLDCRVEMGFGWAAWEKSTPAARFRVTRFVPPDADACVTIIERSGAEQPVRWTLPLTLGSSAADARFAQISVTQRSLRAESVRLLPRSGALEAVFSAEPLGIARDVLDAKIGAYGGETGGEPAFAVRLPARERLVIAVGCCGAEALGALAEPAAAQFALERTKKLWRGWAGTLKFKTESAALDRLINGWCAYQAFACRVLGRCGVYQSGGAWGFRDQLQDCVNIILLDPAPARRQILRCCARQYREGDVQHWWHTGGEVRGVRTRCSDDLVWLPWAVCEYVEKTGDAGVLRERAGWLESEPLRDGEADRYEAAGESADADTVLVHCMRALELVLSRGTGAHGLLLIGSGDWNDAFSGMEGGESVWLTEFFCHTAARFARLCGQYGADGARRLNKAAEKLGRAVNEAWDGGWFRRGYWADGTPLGTAGAEECEIDSIAQAWAAMYPGVDAERVRQALANAEKRLFDRQRGVVKLFDPPFTAEGKYAGYISGYGPGFRENGGQYTHGALWLVMALLRTSSVSEAWELLSAMLPSEKSTETYKAEPYVLSADVNTSGEAGWSWYTGSAGWLLRVVTEELLGLKMRGGKLLPDPKLPPEWSGFAAEIHGIKLEYRGGSVLVNSRPWDGKGISLKNCTDLRNVHSQTERSML